MEVGLTVKYEINAIETRYQGVNFRSRLEAKWAAMFDLLGWRWTYEPCDFCGWIPDFAIHGETLVYVEVKPVCKFPIEVADKIDASGCKDEALILGVSPWVSEHEVSLLGWLRETLGEDSFCWGTAVLARWRDSPGNQIGFCHEDMSFSDRITGEYDGGSYGTGDVGIREIDAMWRESGNRTRWEKK